MAKRSRRRFKIYESTLKQERALPRRSYADPLTAVDSARSLLWERMEGVLYCVHDEQKGKTLVEFKRTKSGVLLWSWEGEYPPANCRVLP